MLRGGISTSMWNFKEVWTQRFLVCRFLVIMWIGRMAQTFDDRIIQERKWAA